LARYRTGLIFSRRLMRKHSYHQHIPYLSALDSKGETVTDTEDGTAPSNQAAG